MRLTVSALLLVLALCGCAPQVTMNVLAPASAHEVTQLRRIAVARFNNDDGNVTTAAVEQALGAFALGPHPYFTLVDAGALRNAQDPNGVAMTFDTTEYRKRAKGPKASGLVLGTVSHCDWRDERILKKRSICVRRNKNDSCTKYEVHEIPCIRRTGSFAFTPKVVNIASGRIVFAQEFAESQKAEFCRGTNDAQPSGSGLVDTARKRAIADFVKTVAPHVEHVRVSLITEDESAMDETTKQTIAKGVDFAQAGNMDQACAIWNKAEAAHPQGHALPYLRGVCAEHAGDFQQALLAYKLAEKRCPEPSQDIADGLARVQKALANSQLLEDQLN